MTIFVRSALWLLPAVALLLIGACVPLLPEGTPEGTATPPQESSASEGMVAPATASTTSTEAITGVVAPTVNSSLILSAPVTISVTVPISPHRSIIGPVGEPQMHSTPDVQPATDHDDE